VIEKFQENVRSPAVLIADQGVMAWTTPRADQDDRHGR
jgi:hypothetical protein